MERQSVILTIIIMKQVQQEEQWQEVFINENVQKKYEQNLLHLFF